MLVEVFYEEDGRFLLGECGTKKGAVLGERMAVANGEFISIFWLFYNAILLASKAFLVFDEIDEGASVCCTWKEVKKKGDRLFIYRRFLSFH